MHCCAVNRRAIVVPTELQQVSKRGFAGISLHYSKLWKRTIKMTGLMVSMLAFVAGVKDKLASEKGATATEYSLLVAFIAFARYRRRHVLRHRAQRLVQRPRRQRRAALAQLGRSQLQPQVSATRNVPRPCTRGRGTFLSILQLHLSLGGSNEAQQVKGARSRASKGASGGPPPSSSPSWLPSCCSSSAGSSNSRTCTTFRFRSPRPPARPPGRWPSTTIEDRADGRRHGRRAGAQPGRSFGLTSRVSARRQLPAMPPSPSRTPPTP